MTPNTNYPEKTTSMADLIDRLSLAADRLEASIEGLTPEECEMIIAEDEWSIRGCIEHVAHVGLGWSDIFYQAIEGDYPTPRDTDTEWNKQLMEEASTSRDAALSVFRNQNERIADLLRTMPQSDFDRPFRIVSWLTEPFQINESINWGLVLHVDYHLATIHKLRTLIGKPLDWMAVYLERFRRPT